ncbi:hypothetical protein Tco_0822659 [Tanacetum coccineum]|uniref:Uncharacterized protein n=1 Tax=Tanacetum coccineum TaxID=301880 RepID=A0ABQ5AFP7_9ASTR
MAVLESCPKHNMVAYLEKTDGNTEFHEIISFLTRSSIHYALTVSPVVSTTFVEQFWMSAKSKLINNVRYITAKVAGKPVSISEASIRSDLLFNDADGIDSLPNQAIFDAIQLMGYEGDLTVLTFNKALFSPQWRFLFHTMNHCISSKSTSWDQIPTNIATALKDVPVPLDHFPINALTSKVFSFMVKKGKHFSGNVTPLFDYMLVQPTEDKGDTLERQSEPQLIPSPPHPSTDQHKTQTNPSPRPSPTTYIPDSIPEGSGGNHGGQSSSDRSLSGNEGGMTLQSVYDLCISLCTQVTDQAKEIKHLKAQIKKLQKKAKPVITHHRAWMKSGRKSAKVEPTVHKDPTFDELDDDAIDYMETEDAQDVGRTRYVVHEEKESAEKEVSTEDALNTDQPKVSTDKEEVSTDRPEEGTDKQKVSTDKEEVSTDRPDEDTVDQNEGRSATQTAPTTTTPTIFGDDETIAQIDSKDKGKKKIEEEDESDTESEGITKAEKKFKQLVRDEEVARKVQEDWEAEEEVKKARLNANKILAEKLQEEEREMYTIEQRAKLLHDTIAAQRRFLAQQRSEAIRNKPPSRNQLRNQMMTYLKHVGGKKHSDLKTKSFEEIKALYDKIKMSDDSFIAIGSAEDEKVIKEMNEQVADASKKRVKKDDSIKGEIKEEEGTRKRKLVSDKDKELDYEILDKKYPIIELRFEYLTTKPQYDETEEIEDVYLNVVIRSNRQRRYFSTLMAVLSILDRDDICVIYQLVMNMYQDETPEGFDKILWGDLIIISSGIHTIMTDEGIVIHMLVENKYPLKKEVLSQLLKLKLETEEDSTMALELIRFVKKQIAELEPEDSDGDEKDL